MGNKKKGRMVYVPGIVITEVDDIMREEEVSRADAFKQFTRHCRRGRDVDRLVKLDFTRKKRLPPIDLSLKRRRK